MYNRCDVQLSRVKRGERVARPRLLRIIAPFLIGTCYAQQPSADRPTREFNVVSYGAKCDNNTDDRAAIQAAINAAATVSAGTGNPSTLVTFPTGTCIVASGSLMNSRNSVSFAGQGIEATYIVEPGRGGTFDLFNLSGAGYYSFTGMTLKDFTSSNNNYAINNVSGANIVVSNLQIGGFLYGIAVTGTAGNFTADNLQMAMPTNAVGVTFSGTGEVRRLLHSIISNASGPTLPTAAVKITGGAGYDLVGNEFEQSRYAMLVQPGLGSVVYSINAVDDWFDTSTNDGVLLDASAAGSVITRVSMTGDWFSSSSAGNGIEIKGVVKGVHIANSEVFANAINGVKADDRAMLDGLTLTGNLIAQNAADGVYIGAGDTDFTITGNIIGPAADFRANGNGVVIAGGAGDYFTVVGNNLSNNTSTALTNSASGTHITVGMNQGASVTSFGPVTGTHATFNLFTSGGGAFTVVGSGGCTASVGPNAKASAGAITVGVGGSCTYTFTLGGSSAAPDDLICVAYDQTSGVQLVQTSETDKSCSMHGVVSASDVIIWGVANSW